MQDYKRRIQYILNRICEEDIKKGRTKGWEFIKSREVNGCFEFAFRVPRYYSIANVQKQSDAIYASCGCPVEIIDYAGVVVIRLNIKPLPKRLNFNPKHLVRGKLLVGYDMTLEPVYHPLNTHLLIGGTSGSGKSDCLRFLMYQLINQGYDVRVVDMKTFSFMPFRPLITKLATNIDNAATLLEDVYNEMMDREEMVLHAGNRNIINKLRPIVVVIDEGAQLAPYHNSGDNKVLAKICDEFISKIAQKGREPKVFLIYCTQRPDADSINKQLKANCESAIAFRTKTHSNSEIIIDRPGAEKISPDTRGRCIYSFDRDYLLQVPFIGNDENWKKLLHDLKTEVVSGGNSNRAKAQRTVIDVTPSSSSGKNKSNCKTGGIILPISHSEPHDERIGTTKIGGVDTASNNRKGMETDHQREETFWSGDPVNSFE